METIVDKSKYNLWNLYDNDKQLQSALENTKSVYAKNKLCEVV